MRMTVAGLIVVVLATAAHAQTVQEKTCILRAAALLPLIPGLTVSKSTASALDKSAAIMTIIQRLVVTPKTGENLMYELAPRAGIADQLLNTYVAGNRKAGDDLLRRAVVPNTAAAFDVDLEVMAAAQTATYRYTCLLLTSGTPFVSAAGIVR